MPDKHAVFSEIDRVLRPGGRLQLTDVVIHTEVSEDARKRIDLCFYEHVISHRLRAAALEERLDEWNVWPRIFGGCHVARATATAIEAAGFVIEQRRRFRTASATSSASHVSPSRRGLTWRCV